MRLGEKVLSLIKERKVQQNDFAKAIGVSPKTVSSWKEENRNPSWDLIVPICRFLEVTPNKLLEFDELPVDGEEREQDLLKRYRCLDFGGKARVDAYVDEEYQKVRLEGDSEKTAI
jgi:transcriptional regulator with XRE-family HTH domain